MEARRASIATAQLVRKGFSKEQAVTAVCQGPEAVANLMFSSTAAAQVAQVVMPARAVAPQAVSAATPVDISWMFGNPASGDEEMAQVPTESVVEQAAMPTVNTRETAAATSSIPVAAQTQQISAARQVDISWMFQNPTLSDEQMAQEIGATFVNESGIVLEAFQCQCCFEDVPETTGLQMSPGANGCDHALCPECFERMISGQIDKKEPCTCPLCPATSPSLVPGWLVRRVLGEEMAAKLSTIEQVHLGQADGGQLRLWQCPTPDCTNRLIMDDNWDAAQVPDAQRVVKCECCKKRICFRCNVEEHEGFTCQKFREWRQANDSSEQSYVEMTQQGLIKPCPNCAAPILKNEGCNFMTCPTCNDPNRMCWQTGKKRYGPTGCGGGHNCH